MSALRGETCAEHQTVDVFEDKAPHVPAEPLKLTLADILAIVFGFALFFALPPSYNLAGLAIYGFAIPMWFVALIWSTSLLQGLALATSAAILARRFKYGRMPRPAEWLALVIALHFLSRTVPNVDTLVNFLWRMVATPGGLSFSIWRWGVGGVSLALVGVLFLLARKRTGWLSTVLLGAAVALLMWGPCPVLELEFADLFPPLPGIGTGWRFWLAVNCVNLIGALPLAVLFGVPAVATIFERRRNGMGGLVWTEWVAMGSALALGALMLLWFFLPLFEAVSVAWISSRIVQAIGLVIAVLLSRLLVNSGVFHWGNGG